MCGIVGYIGKKPAQEILFSSLSRLEYRGYDSSGIAVRGSGITLEKDCVRVNQLQAKSVPHHGTVGIGHTRWATHGCPSARNSHPHLDCTGRIAVVHNGVITNYQDLRRRLIEEGHVFISDTDTEVIPHLIEKYYRGNLEKAVSQTLDDLEGSYAIGIIVEDERKLIAVRKDSPLVIGVADGEYYLASDVPALLDYTNRVVFLENGDIAVLGDEGLHIYNRDSEVARDQQTVRWTSEDIGKCGFEHHMLKEIYEQPRVVQDTLAVNDFSKLWPGSSNPGSLLIVACGSSYHAGCIGKHVLEELLGIPVAVKHAAELNCRVHYSVPDRAIFITQSGESADVLQAMKKFKEAGTRCLVISNVPNSSACRLADEVLYTCAGPEICVAATKSFVAQLITMYRLGFYLQGKSHGGEAALLQEELDSLPHKIKAVLDRQQQTIECAHRLAESKNAFYIGRGLNLPIALERALKLKEISYIHAEACAAGELKHGPLALLETKTPVVAITSHDRTYSAMLTSIKEVKARNAHVIGIGVETCSDLKEYADEVLTVPDTHPLLSPVLNTVVVQLLAYHAARKLNCPIDFPRNLAKSVTVE
jgi:glucosamine--fructose-6-phosphate aminotransferase (isomerizing)